jgi:RHS repeat-associated protein
LRGKLRENTPSSYYRARYYDPTIGRFGGEDPLRWDGDDINFYVYASDDPNIFDDPDGLSPKNRKYDCSLFGGCSKKPFGPPGSVKPGCPCKGGPRLPDFVNLSVSFTLPWTGGWGSWTLSGSVDRFGSAYFGPIGPGVGRSAGSVSLTLTPNYVLQKCKPDEAQLTNVLTGHGVSGAAGYFGGVTAGCSSGGCNAGAGLVTPQIGGNYSYSFKVGKLNFAW